MQVLATGARWFANVSIARKLYAMAGVLLALMVVVGVIGLNNLSSSSSLGHGLYTHNTLSIEYLDRSRAALGNADADVLKAATGTDSLTAVTRDFEANRVGMLKALAAYARSGLSTREQHLYARLRAAAPRYRTTAQQIFGLAAAGRGPAAQRLYHEQAEGLNAALDAEVAALVADNDAQAASAAHGIDANYSSSRALAIALLALAVLAGAGISYAITRAIKRAVAAILERSRMLQERCATDLRGGIEAMAAGDLTVAVTSSTPAIEDPSRDELGQIAHAVNGIRDRIAAAIDAYNATRATLSGLMSDVTHRAGQVAAASQEMAATSEQSGRAVSEIATAIGGVAEGAERQSQLVISAQSSADTVTQAIGASAAGAQVAAQVAGEARVAADEGVRAIEQVRGAMSDVRESSESVAEAIRALASKSSEIGAIVETITRIADQTNLLALNAAIEAARAGEQGRGFAVVADEVRNLAEESQVAGGEIASLIHEIQRGTSAVVSVVEDGVERTEAGSESVEQLRSSFERIIAQVSDMSGRIEQIAASAEEVAVGSHRLSSDISDVAGITEQSSASSEEVSAAAQQTSASTEQVAASAQELAGTAEALNSLVARFKIDAGAATR